MIRRASQYLVPLLLGAMAWAGFSLVGCKPAEKASAPVAKAADAASDAAKKEAFRQARSAKNVERNAIMGVREKLIVELEGRVEAMRAKLAKEGRAADDAAVKAELEKDPEWNSLVKRIEDATAAVSDNRQAMAKLLRDYRAPQVQQPKK